MTIDSFLVKITKTPEMVTFDETLAVIDAHYDYAPTRFTNGNLANKAGQNTGSCKVLAFCQLHELTEEQTLACFGGYYREDVLSNPSGNDHQNIRNFMVTGWKGVDFDKMPLKAKAGVHS
ncbi:MULTISPECIES: HopJ type III effector protein [Salinivibrio]|uniref:HopJ type III effector protein n=1 Tax=Salinivibrio costicola TaxID=51367 RepID=A0ABX6K5G7_SALCS|nr:MULTISPECIES: HopJ type III effector protein [Salinivibrio]ODQ01426.1 type III effector [Salinivibrio sp. DV]OOF08942.1 type III effector [Salinivibrio sp. PR5]OOF15857.1 type III effector [Salinivibrio sp. PR919]OOF16154.1 type III effector [Salinivibrio sp. PR932]OOF21896.1 type III effector [Salinivibrio proteolyticus]